MQSPHGLVSQSETPNCLQHLFPGMYQSYMTNQENALPRWLLTVTGPDRPGIIAAISRVFANESVDIEDITMTRLSGNFAMILLARGGAYTPLESQLSVAAAELGMSVHLTPASKVVGEPEANGFVSAVGPNRVGIVAELSRIFAAHGANIVEMSTRLLERTEVPVYLVRVEVFVPSGWDALAADLESAGTKLGVELRFEAAERVDL